MKPQVSRVERMGMDLQELAMIEGKLEENAGWDRVRSIGKKLEVLGRKPSGGLRRGVEVEMICRKCDWRMDEEDRGGRYRDLHCEKCGTRVGVIWGLGSRREVVTAEPVEEAA